jgi:hypothetical protein
MWCASECGQVKTNNPDTCCEQVEEVRTTKRNNRIPETAFLGYIFLKLLCYYNLWYMQCIIIIIIIIVIIITMIHFKLECVQ